MIKHKTPLHIKVSLLSGIIFSAFALSILYVTHTTINETLVKNLKSDAEQLVKTLNEKIEFLILFESEEHKKELKNTLNNLSYFVSIHVEDLNNNTSFEYQSPSLQPEISDFTVKTPLLTSLDPTTFGATLDHSNNHIGYITLRASTKKLNTMLVFMITNIAILTVFFLGIVFSAYLIASKYLLQPLKKLTKLMSQFSKDPSIKELAPNSSTREFQHIATSYNLMTKQIQTANENLDTANKHLLLQITEKDLAFEREKKLEEQLFQSQKLEAIGRMTAAISHDFNNILGGILGFARLSLDEVKQLREQQTLDFEDLIDSLEEIEKGGTRAKAIIRQLLVFSRKAEAQPVALDPHKALDELYPFLKTSIPSTLNFSITNDARQNILIDPTHFEQIVLNLVINARDALGSEGTIEVHTKALKPRDLVCASCKEQINDAHQTFVMLTVKDSGTGIEEKHLQQIFDPFFSTKDKDKGTGMGLSIIHGLVHKNHGHIQVNTSPQGTEFTIYFPEYIVNPVRDSQSDDNQNKGMTTPPSIDKTSRKSMKPIMVVDDNEQFLKFLRLFLTSHGYTVVAHTSPTKALTEFIENQGDYLGIISDYLMPGITGAELCSAVLRYRANTNIIICSGYNDDLHNETAAIPGVIYLSKPIDQDELLRQISIFSSNEMNTSIGISRTK